MIRIRELRDGDVAAIPGIDGGAAWARDPAKWATYGKAHAEGLRVCFLAKRQGRLIGYASLVWTSQHPPFAAAGTPEIQDMVVAQADRGGGAATALIGACEDRARLAGHAVLGLGFGLYADYGPAQRLYVRLGYQPDGVGVTWRNRPVIPGAMVRVDDDLVLWLRKSL